MALVASLFCVAADAQSLVQGAGAPALVTQAINEGRLVQLVGNTRPEATAANDRGRVADNLPMAHMMLQLRRSPEQEQALLNFIDELHDPQSANYHHWLTAAQYGSKYGLAQQDLDSIVAWLRGQGFTVNSVYPSGVLIDFSGSAGQVRQALHTEIHNLQVNGETHIANMSDPQIPEALAPAVLGVVSLHDFKPHALHKARPDYTVASNFQPLVPADLATIYNLNPLFSSGISGQGQTVVVIEDTDVFATSDWTTFRSTFGLASSFPAGTFTTVHPAGSGANNCTDPGANGDDGEAILDAEWASAAAPSAAIEMASCNGTTTFGGAIALQNLLNDSATPPAIVSISYGFCEAESGAGSNAFWVSTYQQAVTEGVSVFVSSGDEGAASCDANKTQATHGIGVSGFTSTPYNVSVGGTDYGDTFAGTNSTYWNSTNTATFGSAKSYIPEIPWNDSCASALIASFSGSALTYGSGGFCNSSNGVANYLTTASGSGGPSGCATGSPSTSGVVSGTCAGTPKPSWQTGVFGIPNDGVRDIPDVSLFAANGVWGHYYVYCYTDTANGGTACSGAPSNWSGAGGTSFSSPIMAAMQSLVNQATGQRQGNPNPIYYKIAAAEYGASGNASCNSSKSGGPASSCVFYDVTQGDMDVNCTGTANCYRPSGTNGVLSTSNSAYDPAYGTATGWDFATGIGTVNAYNLVNGWTPGAPASLKATAGVGQVSLSWTAGPRAASYKIYQGTATNGEGTTPVASVTGTNTAISGLTPGKTYFFKVTAVDTAGESASSNEASAVPTTPAAPTGVTATAGGGSVVLHWNASSGATGYKVYQGTTPGGESNTAIVGVTTTSYTVTGLTPGQTYYFKIAAAAYGVHGAESGEVNAVPLAPAPTGLTAVTGSTTGTVALNWNAVSGASGYKVYEGTTPGGESNTAIAGITTTSYTATGLTSGHTYYFKVAAATRGIHGPQTAEVSAIAK